MPRGGWVGKENVPTRLSGSGVWTIEDVAYRSATSTWPRGNFNIEVGSFTKQNTTGNQDITIATDLANAPAGSWAVVFWFSGSDQASGVWDAHIGAGLGFAANGGGTVSQYAVGAYSLDGQTETHNARRTAVKAITLADHDGITNWEAEMAATPFPSATTMRINWTVNGAGANLHGSSRINYMLFSGLSGAKAITWTTPSAAGAKSVTGAGFNPDLVLHATDINNTAVPGSSPYAHLNLGAHNKHGQQWANGFVSQDALADTNTSRWQQTDACLTMVAEGDLALVQAHHVSMDADGFTTYFSSVSGTRNVISLCLDGVSSKLGAFSKTTAAAPASQTVASRQGFLPRGALFSSFLDTPQGSTRTHAYWNLGATDMANERSAHIFDQDAQPTTYAKTVWSNDKVILSGAGSTTFAADLTTTTADSFSLNFTTNDTNAFEHLYLLVGAAGTDTFPAKVNPASMGYLNVAPAGTAHSNQKKVVELSNGVLWAVIRSDDTNYAYFVNSADGGKTWSYDSGTPVSGWLNGSIDSYVDTAGNERLVAVWKQSGTAGGARVDGYVYLMVATFSSDRRSMTWGAADTINTYTTYISGMNYPDLVVAPNGSGAEVFLTASFNDTANTYTLYHRVSLNSSGVKTNGSVQRDGLPDWGGGINWGYFGPSAGNTHPFPSIDVVPATLRILLAWSNPGVGAGKGIRFRTASHSSGVWTWASEVEVDTTQYIVHSEFYVKTMWDGTRAVIAGSVYSGTVGAARIYDSTTFTSFTTRSTTGPGYRQGSAVVDTATGDVYFFRGQNNIAYIKWTRGEDSFGTRVDTDEGASTSAVAFVSALPLTGGIGWVYTSGNNAPYSVKYDRLQLT